MAGKQFNFRLPDDDISREWVDAQDNLSLSLKLLIRRAMSQTGTVDYPGAMADGLLDQQVSITRAQKPRPRPRRKLVNEVVEPEVSVDDEASLVIDVSDDVPLVDVTASVDVKTPSDDMSAFIVGSTKVSADDPLLSIMRQQSYD